ncbi:ATP-binding protein [Streptomyces sp. NPDC014983]|uniref:ATP-binding protein n=1 Tax=Streptomyces sp. NPDC014983 TaxID=3364933 RepID=UPI0036F74BD2
MTALSSRESLAVLAHGMGVERVAVEIESCERNVGKARRFAREQLVHWGLLEDDELTDRVLLVVSELVTNAVLHARTQPQAEPVGLELALKRDFALGVVVTDNSSGIPLVNIRPSVSSISGRGLVLVDAHSDGWITAPYPGRKGASGKSVWAFFECPQLACPPKSMPQSA